MNKSKYPELEDFRRLDAAPRQKLGPTEQIRVNARLHQILTTDPERVNTPRSHAGNRRTRSLRRVAIPVALAATTAAAVCVPGIGNNDAAYASWTAVPGPISSADRTVADDACQERLDLASPQLDLAERRGEWIALLYTSTQGLAGTCLAHLPAGADQANNIQWGRSTGNDEVPPKQDQFTQGMISQYDGGNRLGFLRDRPDISLTHGQVGDNVATITITTADGQSIEATITNGQYAAWWPGTAFNGSLENNAGPAAAITYTITLNDKTVINNAIPSIPAGPRPAEFR